MYLWQGGFYPILKSGLGWESREMTSFILGADRIKKNVLKCLIEKSGRWMCKWFDSYRLGIPGILCNGLACFVKIFHIYTSSDSVEIQGSCAATVPVISPFYMHYHMKTVHNKSEVSIVHDWICAISDMCDRWTTFRRVPFN